MRRSGLIFIAALGSSMPAAAKPVEFGAVATGEFGYGTNPFLRAGVTKGAALASGTVAPKLTYETTYSTTTLAGAYTRDQYLNGFGSTESLHASLNRADQLTQNLSSTLNANFTSSNRAIIADPTDPLFQDPLNVGRRTNRLGASVQLGWRASALDQFSFGGTVSHLAYSSRRTTLPGTPTGYDQYGLNSSYNRSIDARTSIGAQVSFSTVNSRVFPHSRSIQPSITANRQLNAIWNVQGHIGLVVQTISGPFGATRKSLGFGLNLCGKYTRVDLCLSADRGSQPSGFGGQRTRTSFATQLGYKINEHSRASVNANYSKSESIGAPGVTGAVFRNVRSILADARYDHDINQTLSGGLGARYQWRDITTAGSARQITATVHLTAKFGRI